METKEQSLQDYQDAWEAVKRANAAALENAPSLREELSLSTSDMGVMYKTAYDAFTLENFKEAENLFTSLVLFDARNREFHTGLAAALEALENFAGAISFYANAAALTPSSHLYYRMGKCFMGLGEKGWAVFMFGLSLEASTCKGAGLKDKIYGEKAQQMVRLLQAAPGEPEREARP